MTIRQPAVAGTFYPADGAQLQAMVHEFLGNGRRAPLPHPPQALIAPHAGYIYSGPIAGAAYATLAPLRHTINRVVILGPAHTMPLTGIATSGATAFATPLGEVAVDQAAVAAIEKLPLVQQLDAAHRREHGLEVELPFLQETLADFAIVPLVVGQVEPAAVTAVLDVLWEGPETLIVISSDLSHYLDYDAARALDRQTAVAIEQFRPEGLGPNSACGRIPIQGLLPVARQRDLRVQRLDLRNSGDTAGPKERVVGYGAWAFYQEN